MPLVDSASFQVVYASAGACTTGGTKPGYDLGWEAEASLDLQWAHAMAPHATIYVVEAASDGPDDLFTAVAVASHSSGVDGFLSFSQCPYLLPGGLTTPAMWPDADSTNLTGPL